MSLSVKFKKDLGTLRAAVDGEIFLDVKNPKLSKKVVRFYQNEGVDLSGEPYEDYEVLMQYIYNDLGEVA